MVWVLLTVVFLLMRVAPGDPISAALGGRALAQELGAPPAAASTGRSSSSTWSTWATSSRLDFGTTITDNRSVARPDRRERRRDARADGRRVRCSRCRRRPARAARRPLPRHARDVGIRIFGILIYAAPPFFVGLLAQILFGQNLDWLPASGRASPDRRSSSSSSTPTYLIDFADRGQLGTRSGTCVQHLILPAVTLGLLVSGVFIRLVRVNVLQTMKGDYVEAARARGVSERRSSSATRSATRWCR